MYSLALYFKPTIFIEYSIGCNWTGTTIAETWECCSSENGSQCGIQEGNCYSDDDCFWHLECGTRNCQGQNFPIGSNCCFDPFPSKTYKIFLCYESEIIVGKGLSKDVTWLYYVKRKF